MKLIGYVRVSTTEQAEHGLGLAVQDRAIRGWAKSAGHRIVRVERDEGISGSNGLEGRRGLLDACNAVASGGADGLLVHHLDRLARSLQLQESILGQVWKVGGQVFTVDAGELLQDDPDDPMRTAMRQIIGVFAELERGMIRGRMRAGKREKRARGGYVGGGPALGLRAHGGALVVDRTEQETVDRIRELRAEGRSLREIADRVSAEGRTTKRGGRWEPTTVRRILQRG